MNPGQKTREEVLTERYRITEAAYDSAAKDIENYFMPLLKTLLDSEPQQMKEAHELLHRCPDGVTKSFMMDQIRQASKCK